MPEENKELLEINIEESKIDVTQSENDFYEYVYKKKKYASYSNKSCHNNPTDKGLENAPTENENASCPSTSTGYDPSEGQTYGQPEGQGRSQRTVARVAPYSVAAEGSSGQEENIVDEVENDVPAAMHTLPTAAAATAVDPYEQIECDLQVVTYIQVIQ